jgi:rhamnogalacturonyl hydrolase YesR
VKYAKREAKAIELAMTEQYEEALEAWQKTKTCELCCDQKNLPQIKCGQMLQGRLLFLSMVTLDEKYHEAAKKFGEWLDTLTV